MFKPFTSFRKPITFFSAATGAATVLSGRDDAFALNKSGGILYKDQPRILYAPDRSLNNLSDSFVEVEREQPLALSSISMPCDEHAPMDMHMTAQQQKDVLSFLPQLEVPATRLEVYSAVETLRDHPEHYSSFLPNKVPAKMIDKAFDFILLKMTNPALQQTYAQHMLQHAASPKDASTLAVTSDASQSVPSTIILSDATMLSDAWEQLYAKHPCAICRDVLAAPCVLECHHSFCGECITDYFASCNCDEPSASGSITVQHCCPTCKAESKGLPCYELLLDQLILEKVMQLPACYQQEEYLHRRARYLHVHKLQVEGEAADRRPRDNEDQWQEQDWVEMSDIVLILLAMAVLGLIVASRSAKGSK